MFWLGDLNIDLCKENNPLQCILNDYGLTNAVRGPTCFRNPDEPKLNDVILVNCPRRLPSTLHIKATFAVCYMTFLNFSY